MKHTLEAIYVTLAEILISTIMIIILVSVLVGSVAAVGLSIAALLRFLVNGFWLTVSGDFSGIIFVKVSGKSVQI